MYEQEIPKGEEWRNEYKGRNLALSPEDSVVNQPFPPGSFWVYWLLHKWLKSMGMLQMGIWEIVKSWKK